MMGHGLVLLEDFDLGELEGIPPSHVIGVDDGNAFPVAACSADLSGLVANGANPSQVQLNFTWKISSREMRQKNGSKRMETLEERLRVANPALNPAFEFLRDLHPLGKPFYCWFTYLLVVAMIRRTTIGVYHRREQIKRRFEAFITRRRMDDMVVNRLVGRVEVCYYFVSFDIILIILIILISLLHPQYTRRKQVTD